MNKTKIEWTDYTSNPIRAERISDGKRGHYCTKVGDGCLHCYSEVLNNRFGTRLNYTAENADKVRFILDEKELLKILRTKKTGIQIFICDMTDIFHPGVPFEFVDRILAVAALRPDLTFQILTKRPGRMLEFYAQCDPKCMPLFLKNVASISLKIDHKRYTEAECKWPLPNVWLGTSASNQPELDKNAEALLQCPATVRFVSIEPMLGPVIMDRRNLIADETYWDYLRGEKGPTCQHRVIQPEKTSSLDWVIVGGETGPGARPMHPDWARSVRDQCVAAGVPFFFKQWGEWMPGWINDRGMVDWQNGTDSDRHALPEIDGAGLSFVGWEDGSVSQRVGKKKAGRLLDEMEWSEMPIQTGTGD